MQIFKMFYSSLVDEFIKLAKERGSYNSNFPESGEYRVDYTFGLTLSIFWNADNPDKRTYQIQNANGWIVAKFTGEYFEARAMAGESIANEFAKMKSIHYGTIRQNTSDQKKFPEPYKQPIKPQKNI